MAAGLMHRLWGRAATRRRTSGALIATFSVRDERLTSGKTQSSLMPPSPQWLVICPQLMPWSSWKEEQQYRSAQPGGAGEERTMGRSGQTLNPLKGVYADSTRGCLQKLGMKAELVGGAC